jgi:predicted esterase
MKKRILLLVLTIAVSFTVLCKVPKDNPYASRYHTKGHWTDSMAWKNVVDATDVPGLINSNNEIDSAVFHSTMKSLSTQGGGVIYFKAGVYHLNYSVQLFNGVIIRGQDPKKIRDARHAGYSPPTKFEFPQYIPSFRGEGTLDKTAFKQIWENTNASFGLVNIDINRALIYVPTNNKSNILILGIRSNNANDHRSVFLANFKDHAWQRYPSQGCGSVFITVEKGVVANCRINDEITDDFEMPDFMTNEGHIFKDVKIKFQFGLQDGVCVKNSGEQPGRVELQDNYVKGYFVSRIGAGFYGEKIMKNNDFIFMPCQDLVSDDFYSKQIQEHTMNAYQQEVYTNGKDSIEYYILKPKNYDPTKKYPFLLFLHGLGQHGKSNPLVHFVYMFSEDTVREKYPYFVVIPHLKDTQGFSNSFDGPPRHALQMTVGLVKDLQTKYSFDRERMTIAGVSSGGSGALECIVRNPTLFNHIILMSSLRPLLKNQIDAVKNISFTICAGDDDWAVPVKFIRHAVDVLHETGVKVNYFEYKDASHWSWLNACTDDNFLKLIFY